MLRYQAIFLTRSFGSEEAVTLLCWIDYCMGIGGVGL